MTGTKNYSPSMLRRGGKKGEPIPNKDVLIAFRVTKEQSETIDGHAKKTGNSRSEYCRQLVLRHEPKIRSPDELRFRRIAIGIANNLNQFVHLSHARGLTPEREAEINNIIDRLLE